jgi:hypothetical protein
MLRFGHYSSSASSVLHAAATTYIAVPLMIATSIESENCLLLQQQHISLGTCSSSVNLSCASLKTSAFSCCERCVTVVPEHARNQYE